MTLVLFIHRVGGTTSSAAWRQREQSGEGRIRTGRVNRSLCRALCAKYRFSGEQSSPKRMAPPSCSRGYTGQAGRKGVRAYHAYGVSNPSEPLAKCTFWSRAHSWKGCCATHDRAVQESSL